MNTKSLTLALASLSVVSAAVPAGWTYGGCMILDHFTENISPPYVNTLNSSANTIELCLSTCATPYAGLDGDICYCGTSPFPALSPSADASCNTPCPGDASENCGGAIGFGWVSLYSKSANTTSSSSSSSASSTSSISSTSAPLSYTTSTIYATSTDTITSCAATITNCPARTSTTVYVIGTTIVPCSSETTTSSAILSSPTTISSAVSSTPTTSPVYQNSTAIITSSPVTTLLTSTSVGSNSTTLKATATPTVSSLPTGGANAATSWGVSALLVVAGVAALL